MKNLTKLMILIVVLLSVIFTSCDMAILDGSFWYIDRSMVNVELNSSDDIDRYVHDNIKYTSDKSDDVQTANETQNRKKGDCEDNAVFALALNYEYLGIKGYILMVDCSGAGGIDHAMYEVNGVTYNKASTKNNYVIRERIYFDDIPMYASSKR